MKLIKFKKFKDNRIDFKATGTEHAPRFDIVVNEGLADYGASRYNFKNFDDAEKYFKTFRGQEFEVRRAKAKT